MVAAAVIFAGGEAAGQRGFGEAKLTGRFPEGEVAGLRFDTEDRIRDGGFALFVDLPLFGRADDAPVGGERSGFGGREGPSSRVPYDRRATCCSPLPDRWCG